MRRASVGSNASYSEATIWVLRLSVTSRIGFALEIVYLHQIPDLMCPVDRGAPLGDGDGALAAQWFDEQEEMGGAVAFILMGVSLTMYFVVMVVLPGCV
jgi:hypothetical protein